MASTMLLKQQLNLSAKASLGKAVTAPVPRACRPQNRKAVVQVSAAKKAAPKGFGPPPKTSSTKEIAPEAPCPCGSGAVYEACCSGYHDGDKAAPTPEALLRSRYSAYVIKDPAYIADTTHPDSDEHTGSRASYMGTVKQTMRRLDPLQLTIIKEEPGSSPDEAFITFNVKRRIKDNNNPTKAAEVSEVTERSRFQRIKGRWFYMDSNFEEEEKKEAAKQEAAKPKKLLPFF